MSLIGLRTLRAPCNLALAISHSPGLRPLILNPSGSLFIFEGHPGTSLQKCITRRLHLYILRREASTSVSGVSTSPKQIG